MSKFENILHATTVAYEGCAVLILGPSGSGKSGLALELISKGAQLVSDDRTVLTVRNGALQASAPPTIAGLIEARGIGFLKLPQAGPTSITLVVDLADTETARLPHTRTRPFMGHDVRCLARVDGPHFAAAILLCLAHGLSDPT